MTRSISAVELRQHCTEQDLWIVVDGIVYDMTEFAPQHPGGSHIISQHAGRDATQAYSKVHPPRLISSELGHNKKMGHIDTEAAEIIAKDSPIDNGSTSKRDEFISESEWPLLESILNMFDFENAAQKRLDAKSWAFYSGAANDCLTHIANRSYYDEIWLRPKLLINVGSVSTKARILGHDFAMPIFASPAAMAKLSHPDGELAMAKASAALGITMCVSTNASYAFEDIVAAASSGHPFFYQLYVNKDRSKTVKMVRDVTKAGAKAIVVTIDLPVVGKREADERIKMTTIIASGNSGAQSSSDSKGHGLARSAGSFIDATLSWDDLSWLRSLTDVPIILKGIQTAADARRAMQIGCKAIFISNHGGRAVDTASPALLVLMELHLQCPEIFQKMEVLIDGGIRRGTDILKALCLGATGVGLGRPFMYAVGYGQEGVEHAIRILKDELETAMQQCGLTCLADATPDLLNTQRIDHLVRHSDHHPFARKVDRPRL